MHRRSRPRSFSTALVVAALLAACSTGTADEQPTATPPTRTPTTTAPSPTPSPTPSATATPTTDGADAMTVERAQQIVDATTAVYNDAVIRMLTQQRIGQRWYDQMRNIYEDPMVELMEAAWLDAAQDRFEGYRTSDPTGITDEVLKVTEASEDCFAVRVRRDFRGVTTPNSEGSEGVSDRYFVAFNAVEPGDERDGAGTGWIRRWDVVSRDENPDNLCERENPGLDSGTEGGQE